MTETIDFGTKLWQRSQNSYATTVPQQILLLKDVSKENTYVNWSVEAETGRVYVEFETREDSEE